MNEIQIAQIREMYPNTTLFYTRIAGQEFVVRAITPEEYNTIQQIAGDKLTEEDLTAQTAVIYPSGYMAGDGLAGVPEQLCKMVLEISLFGPNRKQQIKERFATYTLQLKGNPETKTPGIIDAQLPVVIKMAFPEFSFQEIESWTLDEKLKNLARALYALELRGIPCDFQFDDTEEPELTLAEKEKNIREAGGDPVVILKDEYYKPTDVICYPLIIGPHVYNEVKINALHQQIRK